MAETEHVDLNSIENYIRNKTYPEQLKDKGRKANFRKACKKFTIADGHLTYKGKRRVFLRKAENKASFMMFTRGSVIALKQLHLVDIVDVN